MNPTEEQLKAHAKLIADAAGKKAQAEMTVVEAWVRSHLLWCGIFVGGSMFGFALGYLVGSAH